MLDTRAPAGKQTPASAGAADEAAIDLEASIPTLIAILANILTRSISRHCRQTYRIGSIDQRVLMLLHRRVNLSATAIAVMTDLDKAAVSRSLAVLKRERLVDVAPIRPGARLTLVELTKKGRKVGDQIGDRSARRQEQMLAGIPAAERDQFRSVIAHLIGINLRMDTEISEPNRSKKAGNAASSRQRSR